MLQKSGYSFLLLIVELLDKNDMKIQVQVKVNKHKEEVQEIAGEFVVWTRALAHEGKANEDVAAQLAEYFETSKSCVRLVSGHTSKKKLFEIIQSR